MTLMPLKFFKDSECPSCGRVCDEGACCPWCGERVPWRRCGAAACLRAALLAAAALVFADALASAAALAARGGGGAAGFIKAARAVFFCFAPPACAWALLASARIPAAPARSARGRLAQMARGAACAAAACAAAIFIAARVLFGRSA